MAEYLLPCPCGQSVPISPRQAGQQVRCAACGQLLEIPTLGAIRQLPPADAAPQPSRPEGQAGSAARWWFVLLAATAVAAICLAGLSFFRGYGPDMEGSYGQSIDQFLQDSDRRFNDIPPHELLIIWKDYQDSSNMAKQVQPVFHQDYLRRRMWKRTGLLASGAAMLCLLGAVILARRT
jgi:hypothetical protein